VTNPIMRTVFITAAFLVAGFAKGVSGLGLPTVGMGLLGLAMSPAQAAGLMVVPALVTNIWQMLDGPGLRSLVRRLWLMELAICLGTGAGAGIMTGSKTGVASASLGIALTAYAAIGLMNVRLPRVPGRAEWWLGPLVGATTGFISAATGVFVIPAVPYLQALDFEREEFGKALGLSFTVSAVALAWSLKASGSLDRGSGLRSFLALLPALIGMAAGQRLLRKMRPATFRRWLYSGLMLLGAHLAVRSIW
jgi:uncharacterized membrane protein YfcA